MALGSIPYTHRLVSFAPDALGGLLLTGDILDHGGTVKAQLTIDVAPNIDAGTLMNQIGTQVLNQMVLDAGGIPQLLQAYITAGVPFTWW